MFLAAASKIASKSALASIWPLSGQHGGARRSGRRTKLKALSSCAFSPRLRFAAAPPATLHYTSIDHDGQLVTTNFGMIAKKRRR
jgi:hypothetical protein